MTVVGTFPWWIRATGRDRQAPKQMLTNWQSKLSSMSTEAIQRLHVIEHLRLLTATRAKLVDRVHPFLLFLENAATFHALALFTTVTCLVGLYAQLKRLTLFSLHPTCMLIGTFLFLAEGVVAYRNRTLADTLAPIMQRNKHQTKVRTLHQNVQTIGASFLGLGLLFIVAHKAEEKHTVIPHTVHALTGTVVLTLVLVQAVSGAQKMAQMERSHVKIRRWHGDVGLLVWDLLCVTVLLGFLEFFNITFVHVLVEGVILLLWLAVHVQMKRKVTDRAGNVVHPVTDGDEEGLLGAGDAESGGTGAAGAAEAAGSGGGGGGGGPEDSRTV